MICTVYNIYIYIFMYNFASLYCQAVFRNIADTYGIFSEGTMRRVIKETLHTNKRGKNNNFKRRETLCIHNGKTHKSNVKWTISVRTGLTSPVAKPGAWECMLCFWLEGQEDQGQKTQIVQTSLCMYIAKQPKKWEVREDFPAQAGDPCGDDGRPLIGVALVSYLL